MLKILQEVVNRLPSIMRSGEWGSMYIDYDNPTALRMFRKYKNYVVNIHKFIPTSAPIVYHPHPWPAAFIISSGCYEMYLGYGKRKPSNPIGPVILNAGTYYQMTDVKAWHAVRPLRHTFTIAVEGPRYKDAEFAFETDMKNNEQFRKLTGREVKNLWGHFSNKNTRYLLKKAMENCPSERPEMSNFLGSAN